MEHYAFPAYVIDRHRNVLRSNGALAALYEGVDAALMARPTNVIRMMLHPRGLAPRIRNLPVWRAHFFGELHRQIALTADPQLESLLREVLAYPAGESGAHEGAGAPAMPLEVETRLGHLSFIATTTVFGSPLDVTLEEIALEFLHPADQATDRAVREAAGETANRASPA